MKYYIHFSNGSVFEKSYSNRDEAIDVAQIICALSVIRGIDLFYRLSDIP